MHNVTCKEKISISAIIATLSFLYFAFTPTLFAICNALDVTNGAGIVETVKIIIEYIKYEYFDFNSFWNFFYTLSSHIINIATFILLIGIFTKFHRLAITIAAFLLGFSNLVTFIYIIAMNKDLIYYPSWQNLISIIRYSLPYAFAFVIYSLIFIIAAWLTVLYFRQKETPKFLKVLLYIILGLAVINLGINLLQCFLDAVEWLPEYLDSIHDVIYYLIWLTADISEFVGIVAIIFRLTNLKSKKSKEITTNC